MTPHLLIAGAGYLGSAIRAQAANTHNITALTRSGDAGTKACDLSDNTAVHALAERIAIPNLIIHCASSGRGGPDAYRDVFIKGCRNLLTSFPASYFVLTSSTSVYHQTDGSIVDESSPTKPIRETSQILLEAEQIVLDAGGTVARLAGLYGPDRSVIFRKFFEGSAVIEEDGRRLLNQIHREDAASACLHLGHEKLAGLFNVVDDNPMSQLSCYQQLAAIFGRPLPPTGPMNTSRKRAWTHKQVINTKLRQTGWSPRYSSFIQAAKTFPLPSD